MKTTEIMMKVTKTVVAHNYANMMKIKTKSRRIFGGFKCYSLF